MTSSSSFIISCIKSKNNFDPHFLTLKPFPQIHHFILSNLPSLFLVAIWIQRKDQKRNRWSVLSASRHLSGFFSIPRLINMKPKNSPYTKHAFLRIELHVILLESAKYLAQVGRMLFNTVGLYYHVIDVNFFCPPYLLLENSIHQSLLSCPCVLHSKGHNLIAIIVPFSQEGCLPSICSIHRYLIIHGVCVKKT